VLAPGDDRAAGDRHRAAKEVVGRAIECRELSSLGTGGDPATRWLYEHVRRTATAVVAWRACDDGIAGQPDPAAEHIVRHTIRSGQLSRLGGVDPAGGRLHIHVDASLPAVEARQADDDRVA